MMTVASHLHDLVAAHELKQAIAAGLVSMREHPELPLYILNYTQTAQFENAWTPATRVCRGLIHDGENRLVARPFPKFFNHGQQGAAPIALDAPVSVTDKADGSLGILYPAPPNGYAIATRGSFTSEQAVHATDLYRREYASRFVPPHDVTVMFEIVYPANRIVLDYAGLDDLVLLGGVETSTGRILGPDAIREWPGPRVATLEAATLADALALPPRPNAEGIVVRCLRTGGMLKIKQDDYVALHRIVTGLNARTVWEHLVARKPLAELIEPLPDEFHPWVREIADGLTSSVEARAAEIEHDFAALVATLPDGWSRRDFAGAARLGRHPWALFHRLDGKDPRPQLWKLAKPEAFVTPAGRLTHTEDNA